MRIADLLSHGAENGVLLRHLESMTGLDSRTVRRQIERERRSGCPILSDSQHGYWLAGTQAEIEAFCRSMRRRAFEIRRTAAFVELAGADLESGEEVAGSG